MLKTLAFLAALTIAAYASGSQDSADDNRTLTGAFRVHQYNFILRDDVTHVERPGGCITSYTASAFYILKSVDNAENISLRFLPSTFVPENTHERLYRLSRRMTVEQFIKELKSIFETDEVYYVG